MTFFSFFINLIINFLMWKCNIQYVKSVNDQFPLYWLEKIKFSFQFVYFG